MHRLARAAWVPWGTLIAAVAALLAGSGSMLYHAHDAVLQMSAGARPEAEAFTRDMDESNRFLTACEQVVARALARAEQQEKLPAEQGRNRPTPTERRLTSLEEQQEIASDIGLMASFAAARAPLVRQTAQVLQSWLRTEAALREDTGTTAAVANGSAHAARGGHDSGLQRQRLAYVTLTVELAGLLESHRQWAHERCGRVSHESAVRLVTLRRLQRDLRLGQLGLVAGTCLLLGYAHLVRAALRDG